MRFKIIYSVYLPVMSFLPLCITFIIKQTNIFFIIF